MEVKKDVVSISTINDICSFLGSLVEPLFVPGRPEAIVIKSVGEVVITNNGLTVLTEACCTHPFASLIINAVQKHHQETGDGSKWFLLLLKEIMSSIKYNANSSVNTSMFRMEIVNEISSLMSYISCVFKYLRDGGYNTIITSTDNKCIYDYIYLLSVTFFQSTFSIAISKFLAEIVCSLSIVNNFFKFKSTISHLVTNFNILCIKGVGAFRESRVQDGIIFSRQLKLMQHQLLLHFESKVKFVIFCKENKCSDDAILQVSEKNIISKLIDYNCNLYTALLKTLRTKNVSLLLSSDIFSDEFTAVCTENNICLLDGIIKEEIDLLLYYTGLSACSYVEDNICVKNIGIAESFKIVEIGKHKYLNIYPKCCVEWLHPQSLILCAVTESAYKKYYLECWNCLKVLNSWISDQILCSKCNCICDKIKYNRLSQSALTDECQVYASSENLHLNLDGEKSNSELKENHTVLVGCAHSPGIWEFNLSCIFSSLKSEKKVHEILSKSLLNVIKKKFVLKDLAIFKMSKFSLQARKKSEQLEILHLNRAQKILLEPVGNKESLVCNVLNVVKQLLKIDQIVSVTK